jgi:hypothetical protein
MPVVEFEDAEVISETDEAILVYMADEDPDFDEPHWIPRKCMDDASELKNVGDKGTLVVFRWFAEKEGLV